MFVFGFSGAEHTDLGSDHFWGDRNRFDTDQIPTALGQPGIKGTRGLENDIAGTDINGTGSRRFDQFADPSLGDIVAPHRDAARR